MRKNPVTLLLILIVASLFTVTSNIAFGYAGLFHEQFVENTGEIKTAIPIGDFEEDVWWIAEDFEADQDFEYTGFYLHYFYDTIRNKGNTHFEIYEDVLDATPEYEFIVSTDNIYEETSGWLYMGNPVYLGVFEFDDPITLSAGHDYWTTFSMESEDGIFSIVGPNEHWSTTNYNDGSGWNEYTEGYDISMGMVGDTVKSDIDNETLIGIKSALK